ncbi:MAG: 1-acyl-sn-glycerol-3-phosphate acyltransferase [Chrysiogenales bacterium]|nr:MAG: 1-acyl-sn-glycerol-3-phosphate acyltransferase [Chrysiogenales bacterium]
MNSRLRPEIPKERIIKVNNCKKIDFDKPYKFIYMDWWYEILVVIPFMISYIITLFVAIYFGFRVKGRKNLRILRRRGCITISNHCHYFDTVFANFVVLPRALHTAVAQRNCEVPVARQLLRMHRAFPIPANGRGLEMITAPIGEALKRKHHIHFLPEGDLVMLSQTIHRFKPGAFILSYKHQAPIIPMVYVIKRRKFRGKEMGPAWIKITQVIGKPFYPPPLRDDGSVPADEIEQMSNRAATWMEETLAAHHRMQPA